MPASHSAAAFLPWVAMIAPTTGGKSESVGGTATLPFHSGLARSRIEAGSFDFRRSDGLYARLPTRSDTPAHLPLGELYPAGTARRIDGSSPASRPFSSRFISSG